MRIRLVIMSVFMSATTTCRAFSSSKSAFISATRLLVTHRHVSNNNKSNPDEEEDTATPASSSSSTTTTTTIGTWNHPRVDDAIKKKRRKNNTRFRQHVNPLARQYQQPTILSDEWPRDVYDDYTKPLHLDIGCAKGQFLIDMASSSSSSSSQEYNFLGLEVRPLVAQFAKERIAIHKLTGKLDFIGCNANVDLDRILTRYQQASSSRSNDQDSNSSNNSDNSDDLKLLHRVSIQYPDPHFKSHHAKRRVVNENLIHVLAEFLIPQHGQVFLQSDVQTVCDDMRRRFRVYGAKYFKDELESETEYLRENVWGVPTEREVSVLKKGLPVYRALFTRTSQPYPPPTTNDEID